MTTTSEAPASPTRLPRAPGRGTALRWGAAAAAVATAGIGVQVARTGVDASTWGLPSDAALLVTCAVASIASWWRAARDGGWRVWLAVAATGWTVGQAAWMVQFYGFDRLPEVSVADVGYLVWPIAVVAALVAASRAIEPSARAVIFAEAALFAVSSGYILWNLVSEPSIGDLGQVSDARQALIACYPVAGIFLAMLAWLIERTHRSASLLLVGAGAACIAAADLLYGADQSAHGPLSYGFSVMAWLLGFIFVAAAAGTPHAPGLIEARPPTRRLFVVYAPVVGAICLTMARYVIQHQHEVSVVTVVLGVLTGVLVGVCQATTSYDSSTISAQLRDNIRRLETTQERFRHAFHAAPRGMVLAGLPGAVALEVNGAFAKMLGYEPSELLGRSLRDLTHPDDQAATAAMSALMASGEISDYELEKRYVGRDGSTVWVRMWVSRLEGGGDPMAIGHIIDITEQRSTAERLAWAADHDGLTGLANRTSFVRELDRVLTASPVASVAVLFVDLDNFKVVNDSLGHGAGDFLLREMSDRLRGALREHDVVGRFGGDEFTVLLCELAVPGDAVELAERLRREIARPLAMVDGSELFVSASIGVAIADRHGVTGEEMLRDADAAMYRAKRRGRDCVEVFLPGGHTTSVNTLRTLNDLRRGLERSEIVPHYQPIVELASGALVGFEVLARWRHPERGLLGPDEFLPLAEEVGLIGDIGASVLRASLARAAGWRAMVPAFADIYVSVNVSPRQLADGRIHQIVAEALAESGLPAEALWLEITETALMSDVKAATAAMRGLRDLGLHLSVDDFGTGYSSLTYLRRFPVEAIKIDRTFVHGLGIEAEDTTIVEAVVNLGHSLGLTVVAEGVETPLQLARLREMGCDRGQGFLFGRPQPGEIVDSRHRAGIDGVASTSHGPHAPVPGSSQSGNTNRRE